MNDENINSGSKPLRVLISPLDWGLGHSTRIIPIIKILQQHDVQVLIGAEGASAHLLQSEFPDVQILPITGYRVRYSRNKKNFIFKLFAQFPHIFSIIHYEHQWLKRIVKKYKPDAIISDNRFGLYHSTVPSVYITHQLYIETGHKWISQLAQKLHYRYINRFSECWVPDYPNGLTLAGRLSHPARRPVIPVQYIGPLSRFVKHLAAESYDLLVLLSGPEPQRTLWENELLSQLKTSGLKMVLVRGLPGSTAVPGNFNGTVYNHLPADKLNRLIQAASLVIARSGYSTVMDLVSLNKKAILVPTPGQAEQEYLARYLKQQGLFFTCSQTDTDLEKNLVMARNFSQQKMPGDFAPLNETVILNWINSLRASQ